jgi:GTP 3',8-cyclase
MPEVVFEVLIDELARLNFEGRFSHHFLNEPLLRLDLERLVAQIRDRVPGAYQVLYTNGDFLTEERYQALCASGIGHIVITSHSGADHPKRENQQVHFPHEMTLSNRGGYLTQLPGPEPTSLTRPCFAPTEILIVAANGDILLCHEDAERTHVMGNLLDEPLDRIWTNAAFRRVRESLAAGCRSTASDICRVCTNFDLTVPGRAIGMWKPEVWQGQA